MELTYRAMRSEDIKKLTPMMKAAFDEDTRMHTELLEDGPWGYDNGKLLQRMLEQERTDCQVILFEGRMIGAYSVIKMIICMLWIYYLSTRTSLERNWNICME